MRSPWKLDSSWSFVAHFLDGSISCICASIWEDIQTTAAKEAWVPVKTWMLSTFWWPCISHLEHCVIESEGGGGVFNILKIWGWSEVLFYIKKVQALKVQRLFGKSTILETTFGVFLLMERILGSMTRSTISNMIMVPWSRMIFPQVKQSWSDGLWALDLNCPEHTHMLDEQAI